MTLRHYHYVGPDDIRESAMRGPTGTLIGSVKDVVEWIRTVESETLRDGSVVATFTVSTDGFVLVAPRRSEHVGCAGGGPVLSAGEITISPNGGVLEITNQSTGFCPEPDSWGSVAAALDAIPLKRPDDFTTRVIFRKCVSCGQRNLVKDDWFVCGVCGAELARKWNFVPTQPGA